MITYKNSVDKLINACLRKDYNEIKKIVNNSDLYIINECSEFNKISIFPLSIAIEKKDKDFINFLLKSTELKQNANIDNIVNSKSALSHAVENSSEEIIDLLLKENAKIIQTISTVIVNGKNKILMERKDNNILLSALLSENKKIFKMIYDSNEVLNEKEFVKKIIIENFHKIIKKNTDNLIYLFEKKIIFFNDNENFTEETKEIVNSLKKIEDSLKLNKKLNKEILVKQESKNILKQIKI